jgi:hypothetical protein
VSGQNCIDYVTINVPSGREIDAIKPVTFRKGVIP